MKRREEGLMLQVIPITRLMVDFWETGNRVVMRLNAARYILDYKYTEQKLKV